MAQKLSPRAGGGGGDPDAAAKYVPAPSIGHEIGVMFAFMAVMLIGAAGFWIFWTMKLKRDDRKEQGRIEDLRKRGLLVGDSKGGLGAGRDGGPDGRGNNLAA